MISRAIVQEIEAGRGIKGRYGEYVHLDLRAPRRGRRSRSGCRSCASSRKTYAGVDPVHEPIPIRPVRPLHDGRRRHRHRRRHRASPGLYAAGEVACVSHQRRATGSARTRSPSASCSARAPARTPWSSPTAPTPADEAALRRQVEEEAARIEALRGQQKGGEKIAADPPRHARRPWRTAAASTGSRTRMAETVRDDRRSCKRPLRRTSASRTPARSSTPSSSRPSSCATCSTWPRPSPIAAAAAQGVARRPRLHATSPTRNDPSTCYHSLVPLRPGGPAVSTRRTSPSGIWVPEERKY